MVLIITKIKSFTILTLNQDIHRMLSYYHRSFPTTGIPGKLEQEHFTPQLILLSVKYSLNVENGGVQCACKRQEGNISALPLIKDEFFLLGEIKGFFASSFQQPIGHQLLPTYQLDEENFFEHVPWKTGK